MLGATLAAWLGALPLACAGTGLAPTAPLRVPAPPEARPSPSTPPAAPPAPAVVRAAFFGDEGAYLGPFYEPVPDAVQLVAPCVARARAEGEPIVGYLVFTVTLAREAPARIALREATTLSDRFVSCVGAALAALRPRDPTFVPQPLVTYISVR